MVCSILGIISLTNSSAENIQKQHSIEVVKCTPCVHGTRAEEGVEDDCLLPCKCNDPSKWTGSDCNTCVGDLVGDDCQYSNSLTCNNHGTVDASGACSCNHGWAGEHCDVCASGHKGEKCQYSDAKNCFGHGNVDEYGECECRPGWAAPRCESCQEGFLGDNCNYSDNITCNGHGTATPSGACVCHNHWGGGVPGDADKDEFCEKCAYPRVGALCEYSNDINCNSHGTVNPENGQCTCHPSGGVISPAFQRLRREMNRREKNARRMYKKHISREIDVHMNIRENRGEKVTGCQGSREFFSWLRLSDAVLRRFEFDLLWEDRSVSQVLSCIWITTILFSKSEGLDPFLPSSVAAALGELSDRKVKLIVTEQEELARSESNDESVQLRRNKLALKREQREEAALKKEEEILRRQSYIVPRPKPNPSIMAKRIRVARLRQARMERERSEQRQDLQPLNNNNKTYGLHPSSNVDSSVDLTDESHTEKIARLLEERHDERRAMEEEAVKTLEEEFITAWRICTSSRVFREQILRHEEIAKPPNAKQGHSTNTNSMTTIYNGVLREKKKVRPFSAARKSTSTSLLKPNKSRQLKPNKSRQRPSTSRLPGRRCNNTASHLKGISKTPLPLKNKHTQRPKSASAGRGALSGSSHNLKKKPRPSSALPRKGSRAISGHAFGSELGRVAQGPQFRPDFAEFLRQARSRLTKLAI